MNHEPNTTPIAGRNVPYRDDVIDTDELRFWEANPRVYAAVRGVPGWEEANSIQRQKLIAECMQKQESTRNALAGLRRHGGQQEPLIVDLRGNVVIEGNSRLAALKILALEDSGKWGAAICRCYNDLTEEECCALLSEMHVNGKTEWDPYAKAAMYWRQHHELGWDFATIARVNRTNVPKVKTELATVDLMAQEGEMNERKYSWYNVLTSPRAINEVFENNPKFRERVLAVVRDASPEASDPVARASAIFREGLKTLVKKDRPLRKFCSGKRTLQEAVDEAHMSTLSAKLRKIRDLLSNIDDADFVDLSRVEVNDGHTVFKRLRKDVDRIEGSFTKKLEQRR